MMGGEPITVFILSWERPIYLWACLDSLYRYTEYPCRFVIADNGSKDPLVPEVIEGFRRRGLFHEVLLEKDNDPARESKLFRRYRASLGRYFGFVESDVMVEKADPCWLSRFVSLMDADPDLQMVGSYIDTSDFVDPDFARELAPDLSEDQRSFLIKEHSPERFIPRSDEPLIEPFNPPGRLVLLRTEMIDKIGLGRDCEIYKSIKNAGLKAGIATGVRHRHLSLLNFFDHPDYDINQRKEFFAKTDDHAMADPNAPGSQR